MMLTWRTAGAEPWRWFRRPARPSAEPIELSAQRYNYLPARFRHRGELHRVTRVERIWEERGRSRAYGDTFDPRVDRRCFAVSCADARRCTLIQELRAGTWHVVW
jgi:hypothetical protein